MFSVNEIYSLEDIATEFNLSQNDPLLYAIYLARNPDLDECEKIDINNIIQLVSKKYNNIMKRNLAYMNRDKQVNTEK